MNRLFQYRFLCILALICIGLYTLFTIRYGLKLFQANNATKQQTSRLEEQEDLSGAVLNQLMDLDSEMVLVVYNVEMAQSKHDSAVKCLENLERSLLKFAGIFDCMDSEQYVQKQMDQLVHTTKDMLNSPQSVEPERRAGYQATIQQCIDSMENLRVQSRNMMVQKIKASYDDLIRSAIFLAVATVASVMVNVIVFVVLKREKVRLLQGSGVP